MLVGLAMDARAMTQLYATEHHMFMLVLKTSAWLAIGGLIGTCHYVTLRWSAHMLVTGSSLPAAMAVQLVRLAIIACMLTIIIRQYGALPLLAATLGVLASRMAVFRLGAPT
jgi:F1F0 ATPase subunit 2